MRLVYQTDYCKDNEWNRVVGTWGDHMKIPEGTDSARPGNGCESYGRKSAGVELAI